MAKKTIKGLAVAEDVRAGIGDTELMEKYGLSPKQLEKVLRMLVDRDLIDHMQLYERTSLSDSVITKAFVESQAAIKGLG